MNALHVVLMPYAVEERALKGPARVAAQSALARLALGHSARLSCAALGALEKDADDAPLVSNGWHWSLSHGDGFAAGVVAREPVGLDVERIEARNQDVVPRVTSRDELELLGGFTWERFTRVWTAKEAVLKKARVGLAELAQCRLVAVPSERAMVVAHRGRDHVVHQEARARHVSSVTHDGKRDVAILWTWHGEPHGHELDGAAR